MQKKNLIYSLLPLVLLSACAERPDLAPVEELKWYKQISHEKTYRVKEGETIYIIAFRFDKDYRQLAALNHLKAPYSLQPGQILRLDTPPAKFSHRRAETSYFYPKTPQKNYSSRKNVQQANFKNSATLNPSIPTQTINHWQWPAKGRVVTHFLPGQGKKGIDIAGSKGQSVYAAAAGVVAYAGNGLNGYGNLIIIKHDGQFLTAYANNMKNHVVEGQKVTKGQVIAEMGMVDRKFWGLHFEIRHAGRPVNPLSYLK